MLVASPVPHVWPPSFDVQWTICCEAWQAADWTDLQDVSYDWPSRRKTVLHTDMYGWGPGRDWALPTGQLVFESENKSRPCCQFDSDWQVGIERPDWMVADNVSFVGTEDVPVWWESNRTESAHKWSNPGSSALNFYWEVNGTVSQFGACSTHSAPINAGFWVLHRPITARPQDLKRLQPPERCQGGKGMPLCKDV